MMAQRIGEFIINLPKQWCAYAVLIGIAVVILLGLIFIILRKTTYGEMLMSAGFCMGISHIAALCIRARTSDADGSCQIVVFIMCIF
mgnify:CR=1 FL=1